MGKRKRQTSVTVSATADEARVEEKTAKRVKLEPIEVDEDTGGEVDVWLIRKPTKVPAAWLSKLKFPRAGKKKTTKVELSDVEGSSLVCDFVPSQVQMLHVPVGKVRTQKEASNMKSPVANGNDEDAFLEIHSIRRKPVLPVESSKERLKAFGVLPKWKSKKSTKEEKRLPNLV